MDLIFAQENLRGLSDAELQQQARAPSGEIPPFLVMTELGRRKSMRARYDSERARRAENDTTVADELAGSGPGLGAGPGMDGLTPPLPPSSVAGVGAVPGGMPSEDLVPGLGGMTPGLGGLPPGPSMPVPGGPPGYADGGIIDRDPATSSFSNRYAARIDERLAGMGAQADMNKNLALMTAGLNIMGGASPYAAQNVALAAPAIAGFQEQQQQLQQNELLLLQQGFSLEEAKRKAREDAEYREDTLGLKRDELDLRKTDSDRTHNIAERGITLREDEAKTPEWKRRAEWYISQPEETRKLYLDSLGKSGGERTLYENMEDTSRAYSKSLAEARKLVEGQVQYAAMAIENPAAYEALIKQKAQEHFLSTSAHLAPYLPLIQTKSTGNTVTPGGLNIVTKPGGGAATPPNIVPLIPGPVTGVPVAEEDN